ncbi:MAG: pyridine nucleotide-disulfide oxidoreductase [Proteobacteria bacterium]|nr:pyridine nucleotide-disulfide oxidoreductase [Pseudomonadota bacterium]
MRTSAQHFDARTTALALAVVALLCLGLLTPTQHYLTPKSGMGYALGIIGGSFMLLLFLYSARKRFKWLRFMGPVAGWFRFHMLLGVLGPLCILFHSNFSLGATNSNIALMCMLTVAGSGLVGRYIYARIHHGLYGSKLTLAEVRRSAEPLRAAPGFETSIPGLHSQLDTIEAPLIGGQTQLAVLALARVLQVGVLILRARLRLHSYIRRTLRATAGQSPLADARRKQLRQAAFRHVDERLNAARRVANFQAYERLFSAWHALHLPLMFVMLIAGTVHVIAVNLY